MSEEQPVTRIEFDARVGGLEQRVSDCEKELPDLKSTTGRHDKAIVDLAAQHDALAGDVAAIKATVASVKDETTKQTASLVRIEDAIVGLAKQVGGMLNSPRAQLIAKAIGVALLLAVLGWLARHGIKVEIPQ